MKRIGEALKELKVCRKTLLEYERKGLIKSFRAYNGYRYYSDSEVERLKLLLNDRRR